MTTFREKLNSLTPNHCALIHRPLLNSPIGLHYGFLALINGQWQVFHLSKQGRPELVSVEVFAAGKEWDIEELKILDKQEASERVIKALNDYSKYNILVNNCEDFARFIYNGKWHSKQTISTFGIVAIGLFLVYG